MLTSVTLRPATTRRANENRQFVATTLFPLLPVPVLYTSPHHADAALVGVAATHASSLVHRLLVVGRGFAARVRQLDAERPVGGRPTGDQILIMTQYWRPVAGCKARRAVAAGRPGHAAATVLGALGSVVRLHCRNCSCSCARAHAGAGQRGHGHGTAHTCTYAAPPRRPG